jgi:RHS repeat-associated protein
MQHNGNHTAEKYFYLHDRLGSVRQIINADGGVVRYYTYRPFGEVVETGGSFDNPFMFTGQYYDSEIDQYYLRARQYDPVLFRFTSRDPVFGQFTEPMTLHRYLYCGNDPLNRDDPLGLLYTPFGRNPYNIEQTKFVIDDAVRYINRTSFIWGGLSAFGLSLNPSSEYPYRARYDYKDLGFTFQLPSFVRRLEGGEFGNYLAGYALYYNWGQSGLGAAYAGGQLYGMSERGFTNTYHAGEGGDLWDDYGSRFWISKGGLEANLRAQAWYEFGGNNENVPEPLKGGSDFLNRCLLRWDEPGLRYNTQLNHALWLNMDPYAF